MRDSTPAPSCSPNPVPSAPSSPRTLDLASSVEGMVKVLSPAPEASPCKAKAQPAWTTKALREQDGWSMVSFSGIWLEI